MLYSTILNQQQLTEVNSILLWANINLITVNDPNQTMDTKDDTMGLFSNLITQEFMGSFTNLIIQEFKEIKQEFKEIKQDLKEIKQEFKEIKQEFKEIKKQQMNFQKQITKTVNQIVQKLYIHQRNHSQKNNLILRLSNYFFVLLKKLGQGSNGQVYLALQKITQTIYAIKIIKKSLLITYSSKQRLINQIKIQSCFNNNNVANLYGTFHDQKNIYLILQYAPHRDLRYLLNKKRISQYDQTFVVYDILKGLKEIHKNNIIHRDLKPQNILNFFGRFKISDFGCAIVSKYRNSYHGTKIYMSPQIKKGQKYTNKADIWSLGVIIYEMIAKPIQFKQVMDGNLYLKLDQQQHQIYPNSIKLISEMLKINQEERPSAKQILLLEFIKFITSKDSQIKSTNKKKVGRLELLP